MGLYRDREKAGAKKRQQQMASCILKANAHIKRRAKWRENYLYGVTTTPKHMHDPRPFVSEHMERFIRQTATRY